MTDVGRPIPTYVRRSGRMGSASRVALRHGLPQRVLPSGCWSPRTTFPGYTQVVLEIGSGMGDAAVAMAITDPATALIVAEVHDAGVAATVRAADAAGCENLWVYHGDGLAALSEHVLPGTLAGVRAWFPDPWPKRKHHKRRLITDEHVALMVDRLQEGGTMHTATDVASYAEVMARVLGAATSLQPVIVGGPRPQWRPQTKFERAGLAAGREIFDFIYRKA